MKESDSGTLPSQPLPAEQSGHSCDCGACKRRRGQNGRRPDGKCSCGARHCSAGPTNLREALDEALVALEDIAANHEDYEPGQRHLETAKLALTRITSAGYGIR